MTLTLGIKRPPGPGEPSASTRPPGRAERGAALAAMVATAYLVARSGSPLWQLGRFLTVLVVAALISRSLEAPSGRSRAAVACATGIGAIALGAGIGVPHLSKTGLTVTTLAGLTALLAGAVLVVLGSRALLRACRGWRRVAVVPGLVVATALALLTLAQPIAATNVPSTELGGRTPADLGLEYEDVLMPAPDGVVLAGWYVPSTNGAAVVLRHGSGSTRTATLDHAAVLADLGYGVLMVDARGHGESGGRAMDFGWYGDDDIGAAIDLLVERPDIDQDRVGIVGLSMGGEEAIGAAAADDRIRAVVAEGATGRTAADKGWLSEEHGARGWLQEQLDRVTYGVVDLLTSASPPVSLRAAAAAAAPTPMLLIAASEVPEEEMAGRYIRSGAPRSVELWVVGGAGHTDGLDTEPAEWRERVATFLGTALAPTP